MVAVEQPRKRTAAGGALGVFLAIMIFLTYFQDERDLYFEYDRQLQLSSGHALVADDGNPHFWKYAYLIVTYHKMGHQLSHTLQGYIETNIKEFGGPLRRKRAHPRGDFGFSTSCSELSLRPGTITIIEAPEFHCAEGRLAQILMKNPDGKKSKWGIKIVHMVRNPFNMAVSNYHYHSQESTPEPFVHYVNPCSNLLPDERHWTLADSVVPVLSDPILGMEEAHRGLPTRSSIMNYEDFDGILDDCESLYQTEPGFENATYYEHLRGLPSEIGLRMSTADRFRHIALMASDLLMFHRVQQLEHERKTNAPWKRRQFDMITMPMEDWIERPGQSMSQFLTFIFGDYIPDSKKKTISTRYEKAFSKKKSESDHITSGKFEDTDELIDYLRGHAVFGGPLARIEELLNDVLNFQSLQQSEGMI